MQEERRAKVISINVQRIAGVHRMIELLEERFTAEVVAIQESRCGPKNEAWVEKRLGKIGWYMYHMPGHVGGNRWGGEAFRGGIMMWVRKGLKQRLINKEKKEEAQIMTVDVQGWRIHVGYEPPKSVGMSMGTAIAMMTVKLGRARGPTLAVGDWNQMPDEEISIAWDYKQGLEVVDTNEEDETTRWDGNRKVDDFLSRT